MNLADLANDLQLPDDPAPLPTTIEISGLTEDSRAVQPGYLFAALPGTRADGMAYAKQAEAKGAVAILSGLHAPADGLSIPVLRVENPRRALAIMAARFFGAQPAIVAAVTGTNGKTSVAAFLRQLWQHSGKCAASLGTVGIVTDHGEWPIAHTTPDPITLHRHLKAMAEKGVTHLAMEASSHGLAQYRLDGVKLAAGAFTNLTRDHLDYHGTFGDYLKAKLRLFSELLQAGQPAVIDADGEGHEDVMGACRQRGLDVRTVGRAGSFLALKDSVRKGFNQELTVAHGGRNYGLLLPLAGDFQISNALIAAGIALALGDDPEGALSALEWLQGAKGRLDLAGEAKGGAPIFIDYAHTPDALAKALAALRPYATNRLVVVFGCGGDRDKGKRPLMGEVAASAADAVIVTDDNPRGEDAAVIRREIMAGAPRAIEIGDRTTAIAAAAASLSAGDVLLVAGKGHETGQIVGDEVLPYSDYEAVKAALAALKPSI